MTFLVKPIMAIAFAVLFLLVSTLGSAASEPIVLDDEVQAKIGNAFLEQGEYYRAITEFKKILILFPDSAHADYAAFAIGLCYFKGDQHDKAEEAFGFFRQHYPGSGLIARVSYLEAINCLKAERYSCAERLLVPISQEGPDSEYAPVAQAALALAEFKQNRPIVAIQKLQSFLDQYPLHPACERVHRVLSLLDEYVNTPRKSPTLAAVMSAILPGSGYVYANYPGDGVMAFAVNGLFIGADILSFQAENYALAAIVGGVALPFYLGNIWGSANAARKHNSAVVEKLRAEIVRGLDFVYSEIARESKSAKAS